MKIKTICSIMLAASTSFAFSGTASYAQCAGCGANYNKADRAHTAREGRAQAVEKADRGVRPDGLGNALISGGVTGSLKGATAGALSTLGNAAKNEAGEKVHEYRANKK